MEQTYEYQGMLATTWDLLRGDTSQWSDRFFYRDLVRDCGQPVLDVGCGTGRILLDFLADGVDVDGVDNSPEMLALCREKAAQTGLSPNLYEQTMESLDLPRRYQTILVPSSSFQLLTDPASASEAMQRLVAHLLPGGTLAMPFMLLWQEGAPLISDWRIIQQALRPQDGATVRRWAYGRYDPETQLEHTQDRYEILREGVVVVSEQHQRSPATRSYTQAQAIRLYEAAGLTNLRLFHEFTQEPASVSDTIFCVVGRKLC